jgi:hypothetical protein
MCWEGCVRQKHIRRGVLDIGEFVEVCFTEVVQHLILRKSVNTQYYVVVYNY